MSGEPEETRERTAEAQAGGEAHGGQSHQPLNGQWNEPADGLASGDGIHLPGVDAGEPTAAENEPAEVVPIADAHVDVPVEAHIDAWGEPGFESFDPYGVDPNRVDDEPESAQERGWDGRPLFESFSRPAFKPPPRIPNLGHVGILLLIIAGAWTIAGAVTLAGVHIHLFGVTNTDQAAGDIRYTLGGEAVLDLAGLAGCLLTFPVLWHRSFFNGLSWRNARARRRIPVLISAAFICFVLAIVNGWLMPGPPDAPIDRVFRSPGAAWLLFGFGVTFAPFFEEIAFRGFLLPALCTAFDWIHERASGNPPRPLDPEGQPQWSGTSMVIGSILTSIPFAGMHLAQTGNSLGPFMLLICVSMVLCWARLGARSLAASIVVHASYNFMLFSLMLFGTGGFRHMDKM